MREEGERRIVSSSSLLVSSKKYHHSKINIMKNINWRKVLHYVVTILTSIVTTLTTTSCR